MKIRPKAVTPIIPKKTAVPSAWRSSAPAPVEVTSGSVPRMKAKLVIRIGRKRIARRFHRRVDDRGPALLRLLGEFDDQDRVLRGQRDQHDQADLGQDVVVHAAQVHAEHRRQQGHRHDQDDRDRQGQAFELGGEDEEDEDDRQPEDDSRGVAGGLLLEGDVGPFGPEAGPRGSAATSPSAPSPGRSRSRAPASPSISIAGKRL